MIKSTKGGKHNRISILWRYYLLFACFALAICLTKFLPNLTNYISGYSLITEPLLLVQSTQQTNIQVESIAKKWGLSESAIPLLQKQGERRVDYNSTSDILAFYHSQKTGGTSLSDVLKKLFPGGVIPGSARSGYFDKTSFQTDLEEKPISFWSRQRVLYSHSTLRPYSIANDEEINEKKKLLHQLRHKAKPLAEKKYRLMTLIRDPVTWRASSYYETMCHIGKWIQKRKIIGDSSECPRVNLTDVAKMRFEQAKTSCETKEEKKNCKSISPGDFKHCRSIDILLDSGKVANKYNKVFMGDLPQPPSKKDSLTPTYEDVELHTLRDLGGLADFHTTYREDFIWFGITERMQESMCLFYYTLKLDPLPIPHTRFKECRPTDFWEERHFQWVREHEKFDYAIWRAGNAVLDVRLEAMRLEIQARRGAGESLDSIRYLAPGCFSESDLLRSED